jgi:ferredoxin
VKVQIDSELCTCSGACTAVLGDLFLLDDDAEFATVAGDGQVLAGKEPYAQMAITLCPTNAISADEPWAPPVDDDEDGDEI